MFAGYRVLDRYTTEQIGGKMIDMWKKIVLYHCTAPPAMKPPSQYLLSALHLMHSPWILRTASDMTDGYLAQFCQKRYNCRGIYVQPVGSTIVLRKTLHFVHVNLLGKCQLCKKNLHRHSLIQY